VGGLAQTVVEGGQGGGGGQTDGEALGAPPQSWAVGGRCRRGGLPGRWWAKRRTEETEDGRCGEGCLDGRARGRPVGGGRRLHDRAALSIDVARIFECCCLESLLSPNSNSSITVFEPSSYLASALMNILNIARLGLEIHCLLLSDVQSEI
jgi:hypothetical protein